MKLKSLMPSENPRENTAVYSTGFCGLFSSIISPKSKRTIQMEQARAGKRKQRCRT